VIVAVDLFFWLIGLLLAAVAIMAARDPDNPRRWSTALFWALYSALYLLGERLPPIAGGLTMVLMALIAGFGGVRGGGHAALSGAGRAASARRLGHWLFVPALLIPFVTILFSTLLKGVKIDARFVLDPANLTLVSLGCAAIAALCVACWLTRASPLQGVREARRLIDAIGWALVLPHMLAVLGLLFAEAGVGKAVAHVVTAYVNMDTRFVAVAVYCIGMALFAVVMGNGFAAFPVMAGGVGIPVLVHQYHANPALVAAIGMFSAYCGTLMTPMAANFNIVPAALLDLPDRNAVIKAQIPTALPLLGANIVLLYLLMYQ